MDKYDGELRDAALKLGVGVQAAMQSMGLDPKNVTVKVVGLLEGGTVTMQDSDMQTLMERLSKALDAPISPVALALRRVLEHYDATCCRHAVVYPAGPHWTVCDQCGTAWSGAAPAPYVDPPAIAAARKVLFEG